MKTWLCDYEQDGVVFCVSFDAKTRVDAEKIARKRGWELLGMFAEDCPADVEAMIEKTVTQAVIH